MNRIRIALADDHALLRAGLSVLIDAQPDLEVVGEASTADEAIALVAKTLPDVLTLDLTMPGRTSISAIPEIRQKSPQTKILVLTMHDDPAYLRATLEAGCTGYLVKTAADTELLAALRAIAQGRTLINIPLSPAKVQSVIGNSPPQQPVDAAGSLSRRELEVLTWLSRGHTNQEIAEKIFLSVKTIETYRSRIADKLNLRTRAEMVEYAVKAGLLSLGES